MNNTIQYKGYVGSVEFSEEDGIFYGKVMGIRSLISYEGESAKELLDDFHGAIDDYLETCKAEGKEPEVAFKGSFNMGSGLSIIPGMVDYSKTDLRFPTSGQQAHDCTPFSSVFYTSSI